MMKRTFKQLERVVRGFSNHRRIRMLGILMDQPELNLDGIAKASGTNVKTASEHVRRLAIAGLVLKRQQGTRVHHVLSGKGLLVLRFLTTLD